MKSVDRATLVSPEDVRDRSACVGCALMQNRRTFLQHAALTLGGVFATLGLSGEAARAMTPTSILALRSRGTTLTYPLPDKDGVQIDRENNVALVRWLKSVYAFSLECPHQKRSLDWMDKDQHFECPKHHSQFSPDGYYIEDSGRSTRGMDRYAISRNGANIVVDLAVLRRESDDEKAWAATCVTL